ncbi:hypothetical protein [Virgibacillus necropolis]|uniref:Uncharacterized protein n=1 Tax=Virgibacillus necropolis TaxID=163877 RepID=A0A221M8H5_9BACI|nr:hypothetical protein [Virgibacillus necropolis]ASN03932.1 hypothetical protein CFK40_02410 [Virgibacillus necropolis]
MNNIIQKQAADQKTKQLEKNRARFKAKVTERKPVKSLPSPVKMEDLQREKRLRKRAQKQVDDLQKRSDRSKQTIIKQRQHILEFKEKVAKLEYERYETNQKLSKLKEQYEIEIMKRDKLLLNEQNIRKEAEKTVQRLIVKHQKDQKSGNAKVNFLNQVQQLKKSNKALRQQVENYDLLTHEKYGDLEQEVNNLRKEVHIFRNRECQIKNDPLFLLDYMKQYISSAYVPELVDLIQDYITSENLHHFYRGDQNVFYLLMRRVNLLNFHIKKRNNQYKLKSTTNSSEVQRLGYLVFDNGSWQFVDVTQANSPKVYAVQANVSNEPLEIDKPVKAILKEDSVTIIKCFSMEMPKQLQYKKKQTNSPTPKNEYLQFGNFKVLVIGSRFLSDYKDCLEKHGCNTELHNPFEESYERLTGKISRAEIILVCERHIPHSLWGHVDKHQPYVSVLKKDSKDLISTITYLTLQRCELV